MIDLPAGGVTTVQELHFAGLAPGANLFDIAIEGPQRPTWQMVVSSYRPWPESMSESGGTANDEHAPRRAV